MRVSSPLAALITPASLASLISGLKSRVVELGCHPGLDADLPSVYRQERFTEVASLCSGEVRDVIHRLGIQLVPFSSVQTYV